jgi:hypothetical protein
MLPQQQRDELRDRKAEAEEVIRLFHFDHIVLHALFGSDLWWNLDPKMVAPHRAKSKLDTAIVAKVRRIEPKWQEFLRNMARPDKGQKVKGQRKRRLVGKCPHCYFQIRSNNSHYIKIRLLRHLAKSHPNQGPPHANR